MNKDIELIKAIILSTGREELCVTELDREKAKKYELVKEKCLGSFSEIYKIIEKNNILR